jgi:hypothetical protein
MDSRLVYRLTAWYAHPDPDCQKTIPFISGLFYATHEQASAAFHGASAKLRPGSFWPGSVDHAIEEFTLTVDFDATGLFYTKAKRVEDEDPVDRT